MDKKNKFNKLLEFFLKEIENDLISEKYLDRLLENNFAGGAMGVFGDVSGTQSSFSGDNYAQGDSRVPKLLSKKVIRRNLPELTVFATGVSKKTSKSKKKNVKSKQK